MNFISDQQTIGAFLVGFSIFFSGFGVMMFFDRGLLSVGNLLMIPGVTLLLGV